jgi:acyl-CoA reductase-like NAD-dependent aldehyde dehydrogenase
MSPPPVTDIADLAAALAALDAADTSSLPVLISPPGAADWLGVPAFAALARLVRERSGRAARFVLHCADNGGAAVEALASDDIDGVVFTGNEDAYERLERLAGELGKIIIRG